MSECWFCGKEVYPFLHSCPGVPNTPAARARYAANPEGYRKRLVAMRQGLKVIK